MAPGRNRKDWKGKWSPEGESSPPSSPNSQPLSPSSPPHQTQPLPHYLPCPCPTGCIVGEEIDIEEPDDSIRVLCTNLHCNASKWIHLACFDGWEQQVLGVLRSSNRARGWPDKQRLQQTLWTKRGPDTTLRVCECPCGGGHLKKDLTYTPNETIDEDTALSGNCKGRKQRRRTNSKQLPTLGRANSGSLNNNGYPQGIPPTFGSGGGPRLRSRAMSLGSSGLSQHNGGGHGAAGTPPNSLEARPRDRIKSDANGRHGFFNDFQVTKTGSIFLRRENLSAFYEFLPRWKVNGINIKMEDDCPQGNDDTRIFLLTTLGDHKMREMSCALCRKKMGVYDKYPLVNGTFFLSPVNHRDFGLPVRHEGRDCFLQACCLECMETGGPRLRCLRCGAHSWFLGSSLMLGTLYSYDIIASAPCCPPECKSCHHALPLPDPCLEQQRHFSAFSEPSNCPKCGTRDAHYVRRMDTIQLVSHEEHEQEKQQRKLSAEKELEQMDSRREGFLSGMLGPGMNIPMPADYYNNSAASVNKAFGLDHAPQTVAA